MTPATHMLRAICEQPHDDFPRLAYADWLEELALAFGFTDRLDGAWGPLSVAYVLLRLVGASAEEAAEKAFRFRRWLAERDGRWQLDSQVVLRWLEKDREGDA